MKIMIIEDEKNVRLELQLLLQSAGYETVAIEAFQEIPNQVMTIKPDLLLLDVRLPELSGHELCKLIRQEIEVPIIFVTSDDSVVSEINGVLVGADDYIAKPYHPSLLLARIAAVLKRVQPHNMASEYLFEHRGVSLDIRSYVLIFQGRKIEVSKNECKLLGYLFRHKGQVVPRMELIEYLWDNGLFIDDNALSVTVTRIRSKLAELGVTNLIETKRGAGYRI